MLQRLLPTICALSVLLGTAGSVLDHCFPERNPLHSHLDSSPAAPHLEHYQLPHHHEEGQAEQQAPFNHGPVASKSFDVVGGNSSATALALAVAKDLSLIAPHISSPKITESIPKPLSADPSPPDKPPPAAL